MITGKVVAAGVGMLLLGGGGVAAVKARMSGQDTKATALVCGADQVVVKVPTSGTGIPMPMALATAAPKIPLATVMKLNGLTVTTMLVNPGGALCVTVRGATPSPVTTGTVTPPKP